MRATIARVVERRDGTYYAIETTMETAKADVDEARFAAGGDGTGRFAVERRYREFLALHEALTRAPTSARLPPMPPKTLIRTSATTERRVEQFQFILDAVTRDFGLRTNAAVVEFLTGEGGQGGGAGTAVDANRADATGMEDGERADAERADAERAEATRDDDAWMDGPALEPSARDRESLDRLLRSTMRVHRAREDERAVERDAEEDAARAEPKATDDALARDDFATTTSENVSPNACFARAMASTETRSAGASSRVYDASVSGAREAVKADDADALRRVLSSATFDVNAKDNSGMTLLHLACLLNRKRAAEILIAHGADLDARNAQGETARDVAPPTLAHHLSAASRAQT